MKLQTVHVLFLNIFFKNYALRNRGCSLSVNKHALSMWPPSISLGMFSSLVRYVALIMFFNFSIFQSQPLCSSYSGLVQYFFAASVTFVVDKTFEILQSSSILDITLLENQSISIVKKKYRIQQYVR